MELTRILRRRWAATTVMIVLSLVVIAVADLKLPATYQATSHVLFLPSKDLSKTYGGNPYLAFNSTLNQTADVIRYEVTDFSEAQALQAEGYTQGYTITDVFDTAAPVLLITVTGKSKSAIEHTLTGVTQEVSAKLAQQQVKLPAYDSITSTVISFNDNPSAVSSKKLRSLMIVVAACVLLSIALPVIIDIVALRRGRRRDGQGESGNSRRSPQGAGAGTQDRDGPGMREQDYGDYRDYRDSPRRDREEASRTMADQSWTADRGRSPREIRGSSPHQQARR